MHFVTVHLSFNTIPSPSPQLNIVTNMMSMIYMNSLSKLNCIYLTGLGETYISQIQI